MLIRDWRRDTNRNFALLSASLLGWVVTLFLFALRTTQTDSLIWLGRANFAFVAFVAPFSYLFVKSLSGRMTRLSTAIWIETSMVVALAMLTPYVDRSELITGGAHVTQYGALFPEYILHAVVYLVAAIVASFRTYPRMPEERRSQLRMVGTGILATTAVSLVTNALIPYYGGGFAYIHVGTLSTILFLAAVGYAVFEHHLFDVHVVIRATFVFAGLVALGLEFYRMAIDFLVKLIPLGDASERNLAATALTLVVYSFTHEPLKKWLEEIAKKAYGRRNQPVRR